MQGVLHLLEFLHPHLSYARLSEALPCIRICIADVKVQMPMRGEWPCLYRLNRGKAPNLSLLPAPEIKVFGAARMTWINLAGGPWPCHVFLIKSYLPISPALWPAMANPRSLSLSLSRLVFSRFPFHHPLHTSMRLSLSLSLSLAGTPRPLRPPPSSTAVATPLELLIFYFTFSHPL